MRRGLQKFVLLALASYMLIQLWGCYINIVDKKFFSAGASFFAFVSITHLFYVALALFKQLMYKWTMCRFKIHWAISLVLCSLSLNALVQVVVFSRKQKSKLYETLEKNDENLWYICLRLVAAFFWNLSVCFCISYIYKQVFKRSIFKRKCHCQVTKLVRPTHDIGNGMTKISIEKTNAMASASQQHPYVVRYYSS
ncbi:hypothetical protein niasHT_014211 [Heterodera trifolii]|uniref:Uncharacterized protein n=1 Tax=Heterodera trifolii TaxID=157864 RepID=A0ABD2KXG6_9BILA